MQKLPTSQPLSEALISGKNALICHNPDEEIGFAGKKNHELISDIRKYTCRSVLSVHSDPTKKRLAVVPKDCEGTMKVTAKKLREDIGISCLDPDSIIGIPFLPDDSIVSALLHMQRQDLDEILSGIDCASYTMFSPQIDELQSHFQHVRIPGNLFVSESFNNKAVAIEIAKKTDIRMPVTIPAYSFEHAKTAYLSLKEIRNFPFVVKGARSASGYAMRIVHNDDEFESAVHELSSYFHPDECPVKGLTPNNSIGIVIQEYIPDVLGSPGAAVVVGPEKHQHIFAGVTEQCLDGDLHHAGNVYPLGPYYTQSVHDQIVTMMEHAADQALKMGGAGMMLCADFIVTSNSVYLVEFNMRLSAQYGGLALAHDIFGTAAPAEYSYFVGNMKNDTVRSAEETFELLRTEKLLFDAESKKGFVPLNLVIEGQMQGVLFSTNKDELFGMQTHINHL